jgi:beta-lactamase superfamily II metal-dependent hydrolase
MSIKFEFLQHNGESILITIDENTPSQHTILLDGGYNHPFINNFFDEQQPEIDTIIVTHIDNDHINGVIEFLEENYQPSKISKIIFNEPRNSKLFNLMNNSTQTSKAQGYQLRELIDKSGQIEKHLCDVCFEQNNIIEINASTYLEILTPTMETLDTLYKKWDKAEYEKINTQTSTKPNNSSKSKSIEELARFTFKKDNSLPNKSSISFILHHKQYKFLLLGDAHIDEVNKSLKKLGYENNPLILDFIKLSHHGSMKNINDEFLQIVKTNQYIICQTYHEDNKHPNRETIAKVVLFGNKDDTKNLTEIFLTKSTNPNLKFTHEEKQTYNFEIQEIKVKIFD